MDSPPPQRVRPQRLLVPEDFLPEIGDPPAAGWRRATWRAGARWLGPGPAELRDREWARLIRQPLAGPKVIAVMSPKGGVGKSTLTILLGEVLAGMRGQPVAALDANPDAGTLVTRVPEPHSALAAEDLHRDASLVLRRSDLAPYLTATASGLCVLRSERDTDVRLGAAEYRTLLGILTRFHPIVVVDLGTGIHDPAFLAVIEAADAVVPVSAPTFDSAEVVTEGLDWLSRRYPGYFRTAAAVLSRTERGSRGGGADLITEALEDWVPHVIRLSSDPRLDGPVVPPWATLSGPVREASLELAATVMETLATEPAGPRLRDEP